MRIKEKALLTASIIILFTGCKSIQSCDSYSKQCDELYPYYNCDHPLMYSYTPRNYRKYINKHSAQSNYTPGYDVYYPNTQSVYYVPVIIDDCDEPSSSPVTNRPRPSIGSYSGNNSGGSGIDNTRPDIHRKPATSAGSSRKKRD